MAPPLAGGEFMAGLGRPDHRRPVRARPHFDAAERARLAERAAERRHPGVHVQLEQVPGRRRGMPKEAGILKQIKFEVKKP